MLELLSYYISISNLKHITESSLSLLKKEDVRWRILSQNLYVLTTTDNITISDIQCAGPE